MYIHFTIAIKKFSPGAENPQEKQENHHYKIIHSYFFIRLGKRYNKPFPPVVV
jgi:hypothetical protein